ncbi:hypothetical protein [Paraburkholderia youngii]|uniref:hypothetical protein n=1 Tax=Paraburkholderia youngii TaxID=2782701 RepID=UPI003D2595B7
MPHAAFTRPDSRRVSGRELVALELALPGAGLAVGYTVRTDWLGTAVQQAFVEVLHAESASEPGHVYR